MDAIPIIHLVILLVILILVSAFFSGSETGMMSLNRYRLRHLAQKKNHSATRVEKLLQRADRLLGVILLGNTFANLMASSLATIIAVRLLGDIGSLVATIALTLIILIFAEVTPKTLAALYPMKFAFIVSLPLQWLLRILYPFVWVANTVSNAILKCFGVKFHQRVVESLSRDELRTVVKEAQGRMPIEHIEMLTSLLDLEQVTVEDIMVPRNEIIGIDLSDDWEVIQDQLINSQHTRMPIYREHIDNVLGVLHMRLALHLQAQNRLSKDTILEVALKPYFIPEGTSLHQQLLNFRQSKRRVGLIVNEYGDIIGLTTMEDILEEVVGEFTTDMAAVRRDIYPQEDGSYLIDGSITLRELNRSLKLDLPISGPKTLSGLIIEYLEMIPPAATGLKIANYPIEVVQVKDNMVKTARIFPQLKPAKLKN